MNPGSRRKNRALASVPELWYPLGIIDALERDCIAGLNVALESRSRLGFHWIYCPAVATMVKAGEGPVLLLSAHDKRNRRAAVTAIYDICIGRRCSVSYLNASTPSRFG